MDIAPSSPNATRAAVRWYHLIILIVLLGIGAGMRFHDISRQCLWLDEYWSVYLATGRGNAVFDLPQGVVLDPPPAAGMAGAPVWWHIWGGLSSGVHPPLFFLALRSWIDLFGQSELALRTLSALFSLAGVVVLFDLLRLQRGPGPALIGAGLMAFAAAQIDFSQEVRPYTMLVFLSLLASRVLFSVAANGPSFARLLFLFLTSAAMALTHYLAIGPLAAMFLFAFLRLRGVTRDEVLETLAAGVLLAAAVWGPFFMKSLSAVRGAGVFLDDSHTGRSAVAYFLFNLPFRLSMASNFHFPFFAAACVALLVYVVPIFRRGRSSDAFFWWLWIVACTVPLAAIDLIRLQRMLGLERYVFIASPAVYALLSMPLPARRWIGRLVPLVILLGALIYGIDRCGLGGTPQKDWRAMSALIQRVSDPRDLIIFTQSNDVDPPLNYMAFAYYFRDSRHPAMFLTEPPAPGVLAALAARGHVWILGTDAATDTPRLLPGWTFSESSGVGSHLVFWKATSP